MGVVELRRLRQLEEENRKLKKLVADLSLDKHILQEVLPKKYKAGAQAVPGSDIRAAYGLTMRRACRLIQIPRPTAVLPESEEDLGRTPDPIEGPGGGPGPVWVSTIARSAAPGRMEDQS